MVGENVEYISAFIILRNQIISGSPNGPIGSLSVGVNFGENCVKIGQEITKILACEIALDPAPNQDRNYTLQRIRRQIRIEMNQSEASVNGQSARE